MRRVAARASLRAMRNVQRLEERVGAAAFERSYAPQAEALAREARLTVNMIDHFAKEHPALLDRDAPAHRLSLEQLFAQLEARGLPRNETRLLFFSVPDVLDFAPGFLAEREALLAALFGLDAAGAAALLRLVPRVFFQDRSVLEGKRKALGALLGEDERLLHALARKHPYLLLASSVELRGNLYTLLDFGFSATEIGRLLLAFCHFALKRKGNLADLLRYLLTLGLTRAEVRACVLASPLLLSLDFGRMLIPKLRLLRKNGLKGNTLRDLVRTAPWVLTVSLSALSAKFRYLSRHHNLQLLLMPQFPKILYYDYDAFLRPRGELMLSAQKPLWDKVLDISKEEFLLEVGAREEDLDRLVPAETRPELDVEKMQLDKYIHPELRRRIYADAR